MVRHNRSFWTRWPVGWGSGNFTSEATSQKMPWICIFIYIHTLSYIICLLILIFIFRFVTTTVPISGLHLRFVSSRGWQTTTHAPNLAQGLFLCDPRAEEGFYIFERCRKKKKAHLMFYTKLKMFTTCSFTEKFAHSRSWGPTGLSCLTWFVVVFSFHPYSHPVK